MQPFARHQSSVAKAKSQQNECYLSWHFLLYDDVQRAHAHTRTHARGVELPFQLSHQSSRRGCVAVFDCHLVGHLQASEGNGLFGNTVA